MNYENLKIRLVCPDCKDEFWVNEFRKGNIFCPYCGSFVVEFKKNIVKIGGREFGVYHPMSVKYQMKNRFLFNNFYPWKEAIVDEKKS